MWGKVFLGWVHAGYLSTLSALTPRRKEVNSRGEAERNMSNPDVCNCKQKGKM